MLLNRCPSLKQGVCKRPQSSCILRNSACTPRHCRVKVQHGRLQPVRASTDVLLQQQRVCEEECSEGDCVSEEDGAVLVRDDLDALLKALPEDIREPLIHHPNRANLLEVVLDLGRRPEARFLGVPGGEYLREADVSAGDLVAAEAAVGAFGRDNRAGVTGTLHRISAIRNRRGHVIGLTCRVGRAVSGHTDMIRDLVESNKSVLLLGRPGVGKTTVIREIARLLSQELHKRVVIVDTSNEIGGDGDVPHPAIGSARRMQVPDPSRQHQVMIEAVENHTPEVIIVDEIGSEAEALACRTIAERGITLIGTAHGRVIDNLMQNPTLCDLVGGIQSVTLGDETARSRGTKKTVLERKAPPTFPIVVEIRERSFYVAHSTQESVDALLHGQVPTVQVRERDSVSHEVRVQHVKYDQVTSPQEDTPRGQSAYEADYAAALAQRQQQQQQQAAAAAAAAAGAADGVLATGGGMVYNNAVEWTVQKREGASSAPSSASVSTGPTLAGTTPSSLTLHTKAGVPASPSGRGFGPALGSSFVKPHVSVLSGKQGDGGGSGGSRRSRAKAAAKSR